MKSRIQNILFESMDFEERPNINDNFRKWFGSSKVLDQDGDPLVVYHGTHSDFVEFDISKGMTGPISNNPIAKYGFFFAPDSHNAHTYSGDDGLVMPVYLRMIKPYILNMWTDFAKLSDKHGIVQDEKVKPWMDNVKKRYDGIILGGGETYKEYMVFKSTQIKSIFNQGTWDINNPDIMK